MSHTTTLIADRMVGTAARGTGPLIRLLLAVAVLSATVGAVATSLLDRVVGVAAAPWRAPVASSLPAVTARGDSTVPDASAVFAGREITPEGSAPTF